MSRGDFTDFAAIHGVHHELELGAGNTSRGAPEVDPVAFGEVEELFSIFEVQGNGFFGPDMAFGLQGLLVNREMGRHGGGVDEEIERRAGEHVVDVGIDVRHLELLGAFFGAFDDDIADADNLDEWLGGEVWQVRTGDAAAADLAHPDLPAFKTGRRTGISAQEIWHKPNCCAQNRAVFEKLTSGDIVGGIHKGWLVGFKVFEW